MHVSSRRPLVSVCKDWCVHGDIPLLSPWCVSMTRCKNDSLLCCICSPMKWADTAFWLCAVIHVKPKGSESVTYLGIRDTYCPWIHEQYYYYIIGCDMLWYVYERNVQSSLIQTMRWLFIIIHIWIVCCTIDLQGSSNIRLLVQPTCICKRRISKVKYQRAYVIT